MANSLLGPKRGGVDELCRPTGTRVRGAATSAGYTGQLRPGSEELWGRPVLPTQSVPAPSACGVDQLSPPTQTRLPGAVGTTSCAGQLSPRSELTRDRPAVPADSGPGKMCCGVDQLLSRPTQSRVRADSGWTTCPGRIRPMSEELWDRPAIPADSVPGPNLQSLASYPGQLGPMSELTQV